MAKLILINLKLLHKLIRQPFIYCQKIKLTLKKNNITNYLIKNNRKLFHEIIINNISLL